MKRFFSLFLTLAAAIGLLSCNKNAPAVSGDAPEGHNIFAQHTVYYPQNNSTWTEEIREELGESAVWIPYDEGTTPWIKYDIYYVDENKEVVTKTFEHDLTYYVKQKQSTDYNPELAFMLSCFASSAYNDENIKKSLAGMGFDTSDSGSVFEYYDANNHHNNKNIFKW